MGELSEWGTTAAGNNVTSPDGAQTGWVGADVGPWGRETMAAIARWYGEPAWVNPIENGLDPTGTKSITRSGATQIQVTAPTDWGATTVEKFAVDRLIRFQQTTGVWHYAFITARTTSTVTLTLTLSLIGTATLDAGWSFNDNALEFFSPLTQINGNEAVQPMSPIAFGGVGNTTARDAYVPDVTNGVVGMVWINTQTSMVQVIAGSGGFRSWRDVAPLASVWSGAGGSLSLSSAGGSTVSLNSITGSSSELILLENSVQMAKVGYDASGNRLLLEGGDTAATAGQVYVKDTDGKLYYRNYSGGVAGDELNLTPKELYPSPISSIRSRTGAGVLTGITFTNHTLVHSGTLSAEMQALLESSDYDEIELELTLVAQCLFGATPASGVNIGINIFFGDDLHLTPPVDLNTGNQARVQYYMNAEDPYIAHYSESSTHINPSLGLGFFKVRPAFRLPIYTSTLAGTINSFALAARREDGTNPLNFTWYANQGDIYSSFSVARAFRLTT